MNECEIISPISNWTTPEFSVYPNPSSGRFVLDIEGNFDEDARISLYSSLGSLIYQSTWSGMEARTLELEGVAEGVYFLVLNVYETSIAKRVVVMQ